MASQGIGTKCRECSTEVVASNKIPKFCAECGAPDPLGLLGGQQASTTGLSTSTVRGSTTNASPSEGYWTASDVGTLSTASSPATRGALLAGPASLPNQPISVDLPSQQPTSVQDASTINSNGSSREPYIRLPNSVEPQSRQPMSAQDLSTVNRTGNTFDSTTSASYNQPVSVRDTTLSSRSDSSFIGERSSAAAGGLRQIALPSTEADVHQAALASLDGKMQPLSVHRSPAHPVVTSEGSSGASRESLVRQPIPVDLPSGQPISAQDASGVNLIGPITSPSSLELRSRQPISAQDLSALSLTGGLRQTIAPSSTKAGVEIQQVTTPLHGSKMKPLSLHFPPAQAGVTSAGSFGASRESLVGQPISVDLQSGQPISAQDASGVNLIGPITSPSSLELRSRQPISAQDLSAVSLTGNASGSTKSASYNPPGSVQDATLSNRSGSSDIGGYRETAPSTTKSDVDVQQATATSLGDKMGQLSLHVPPAHPGVSSDAQSRSFGSTSTVATGSAYSVADLTSTVATGSAHSVAHSTSTVATNSAQSVAHSTTGEQPTDSSVNRQSMPGGGALPPVRSPADQPGGPQSVTDSSTSRDSVIRTDVPSTAAVSISRSSLSTGSSSSGGSGSAAVTADSLSIGTSLSFLSEDTSSGPDSRLLSGTGEVQPLTINVPDSKSNSFGSTVTGIGHSVAGSASAPVTGSGRSVAYSLPAQQVKDSSVYGQNAPGGSTLPSVRFQESSVRGPHSVTEASSANYAGRHEVPSTVRSLVSSERGRKSVRDTGTHSNFTSQPDATGSALNLPSNLRGHRGPAFAPQMAYRERNVITFYVTVASCFHVDPFRDRPFIELLTGSTRSREKYHLHYTRLLSNQDGWSVDIPIDKLHSSDVTYRYAVSQNNSKVSEWLYNRPDQRNDDGRDIRFAANYGDTDEEKRMPLRYQFGVTMLPPMAAEHEQSKLREEISRGLLHMLPDPYHCLIHFTTADDVLQNFHNVLNGIVESKMFFYREQQLDQVHLSEVLERYFKDQIGLMEEHREEWIFLDYVLYTAAVFILLLAIFKVRDFLRIQYADHVVHLCSLVSPLGPRREQPSKILQRCFDTSRDGFYEELLDLMNDVAESGSAEWLRLVPFFPEELEEAGHFRTLLRGYDERHLGELIDTCIATFNLRQEQSFDLNRWYGILYDTFEMSYRTGHALVGICNQEQLRTALAAQLELPIDGCIAAYFKLESLIRNLEDRLEILRHIDALVRKLLEEQPSRYVIRQLQIAYSRMPTLSKSSLQSTSFNDWRCVTQLSKLMAVLHKAVAGIRAATASADPEQSLHAVRLEGSSGPYEKWVQCIQQWLNQALPVIQTDEKATRVDYSALLQELQMWEMLFDITWPHEPHHGPGTVEFWHEELLRVLYYRLQKVSAVKIVDLFCLHNFGNQLLKREFSQIAFLASDAVFKNDPCDYYSERFKEDHSLKKFGDLISASFTKLWPGSSDDLANLDAVLPWPPFLTVIKLYCSSSTGTLHESVRQQADRCIKMLEQLCSELADFTGKKITYSHLSIIVKHKEKFLDWCQLRSKSHVKSTHLSFDILRNCLMIREQEKRGFDEVQNNLKRFCMLCKALGNVTYIAEHIKRLDDEEIQPKPVAALWTVQDPPRSTMRSPDWLHFPLTRTWLSPDVLKQISGLHESLLFVYFWHRAADDFPGLPAKPNALPERNHADVKKIWKKSLDYIREFVLLLMNTETSGSSAVNMNIRGATFSDGEVFLTALGCEDHKKIEAEVRRSVSHHTTSYKEESASLQNMQNEITKRLCNYSQLKLYTQAAITMKNLVHKLILKGNFSELDLLIKLHIDQQRPLSLVTEALVARGKMLSALAEPEKLDCLNAFCDCMGLITWVRDNIKGGVKEVQVFVELASISTKQGSNDAHRVPILLEALTGYAPLIYNLPEETGFVDFLEACDRLWKNVESNRKLPAQLRSINSCIQWLKEIKETHGEVERTALQQASAINSRGTYVLFNDGNQPKLDDLVYVELLNESNHEENTTRKRIPYEDISDLHNKVMLVAGRVELESPRVEKFVKMYESILRLAEAYIKMYQSGNVWFRYFNVTFEPFSFNLEDEYRGEVRVNISKDLYSPCRIEVMKENVNDIAEEAQTIAEEIEQCLIEWSKYVEYCRVKMFQLNIFTISQLSYLQLELAKLARSRTSDSISNRSLVYDSMSRDTSQMTLPEQVLHKLALLRQCSEADVRQAVSDAVFSDQTPDSGSSSSRSSYETRLRSMTFKEQSSMSEAVLSLECVGAVLQHLCPMVAQPEILQGFPEGLLAGEPNLIVCSKREIYATAVSLYCSINRKPTSNVVLVCRKSTSQEEVDLFLKRTFYDCNGMFCLVHANRLNYDICRFFEQRTKEDNSRPRVNYHLVVLCTTEKSRMVTILQQKKRNIPPKPEPDLRKWLFGDQETWSSFALRSKRAGMGKTLSVKSFVKLERENAEALAMEKAYYVSIQLLEQAVDVNAIVEKLLKSGLHKRRIIHINVTQEVRFGVDELLFDLIILGSLAAEDGTVWQKRASDRYFVECLLVDLETGGNSRHTWDATYPSLELLRSLVFEGPKDCLDYYTKNPDAVHQDFASVWSSGFMERTVRILDKDEFRSATWQIAFQYLRMHLKPYYSVNVKRPEEDVVEMLSVLLQHCGIDDPSWSELHHFVLFLSRQLEDYETSIFCNSSITGDLPGFSSFVIKFLLQMSKDFATRSLRISETSFQSSSASLSVTPGERYLAGMTWKRSWEHNHYPYLFFNSDHTTLTFFDFFIERRTGNLLKPGTRDVIEQQVMTSVLYDALEERGVNLSDDGEGRIRSDREPRLTPRQEKLSKLIAVIGQRGSGNRIFDPDPSYELTKDNVKKMLAINMRFRCGIPVIIMGETGCGKTSLIRFMCSLQVPPNDGSVIENLIMMKVHGGVTMEHVVQKVNHAYKIAERNVKDHPLIDTVLFFDEANTTSAIGLIKEVLCDGTLNGVAFQRPFTEVKLRIVAAVNPYRKHSQKMIERLERLGLGYLVKAESTDDALGSVPLRHLVYRVRPLPQSMLPLVWDFGQLRPADEERYIIQFVERHVNKWSLPDRNKQDEWKTAVAKVLVKCQEFLRNQKEECSFVSLRDIERTLVVMDWFMSKASLFKKRFEETAGAQSNPKSGEMDKITWSLVLALGVCYHACLQPRSRLYFRYSVASCFRKPLYLPNGETQILNEIERCQETVINSLTGIPDNIYRNHALKENIFMMVVCIELRIPLFLVGKPGSSKSLSKSLVISAMQGQYSQSDFFKGLKQAMVTSFQCSPLVRSEAIINVFKLCASYQQTSGTEKFVGVVVLDEVGLAEDAKHMPLKVLHPLLEDGCEVFDLPSQDMPENGREASGRSSNYKKCAFVGISNWALDPAKMNRGIVVQRGIPNKKELEETAMGICDSSKFASTALKTEVSALTAAYLRVFHECGRQQEFFGLRDFYSLMKMLAHFAEENSDMPTSTQFLHAVLRNFGGLDDSKAIELFKKELKGIAGADGREPPCDPIGLITSALRCVGAKSSIEARYLLLLAENDAALSLVKDILDRNQPEIIFGSNFPKDHHLVQICRDINRIKTCMEAGKTVILLNLDRLYESLYDALNQYYTTFGGANFVDLGIGMQRIKCRVHTDFRLIIIADKNHAYEHFPIALKNRLEKHYIKLETLLNPDQLKVVEELLLWAENFNNKTPDDFIKESAIAGVAPKTFGSAFVGYSEDAPAAIVMQVSDEWNRESKEHNSAAILERAQYRLLLSATPGAVVRAKRHLPPSDYDRVYKMYFEEQRHDSLHACLNQMVGNAREDLFLQVTTHYKLLSPHDFDVVKSEMNNCYFEETSNLQAFETERQFSKHVRSFFERRGSNTSILIIQCEAGDAHTELIACARYIIKREYKSIFCGNGSSSVEATISTRPEACRFVVVLLIQLSNFAHVRGFHGSRWINIHLDDLRPPKVGLLEVTTVGSKTIGKLLLSAVNKENASDQFEIQSPKESDVYDVLSGCVHEALSRLEESSRRDNSASDWITCLRAIFAADNVNDYFSAEFRRAFATHLANLMEKKENDERDVHWLHDEAALPANVCKHCTFRRSVEQSFRKRIVPAFASMVAYIYHGSHWLQCIERRQTPIGELWLTFFRSDHFFRHFSSTMPDLITTDQKLKVHVIRRSLVQFPFSWILQEELDSLLKSAKDSSKDVSLALGSFMSKHPFTEWSNKVENAAHLEEAVKCYIHDVVASWSGTSPSGFREAVRRSIEPEDIKRKNCIEIVHLQLVSKLPKYERLRDLIELMDEETRKNCVQSLYCKASFTEMMTCTMEHAMNGLLSSFNTGELSQWRSRIDDCYCITHDLFEHNQEIETSIKNKWKKIVSASLLYDVLTAAKVSDDEVSQHIDSFFKQFIGHDLTNRQGVEHLDKYLQDLGNNWKSSSPDADVPDVRRLRMYIMSDVVLAYRGDGQDDLVEYIFENITKPVSSSSGNGSLMRPTSSVASSASPSEDRTWQTVAYYLYCLYKRTSVRVVQKVCEVLTGSDYVDDKYTKLFISFLELCFRELKTILPEVADNCEVAPEVVVKAVAQLRAICTSEEPTSNYDERIISRLTKGLCQHQSKPKLKWLQKYYDKRGSPQAYELLQPRDDPKSGCIVCKQSIWEDSCIPTVKLFAGYLRSGKCDIANDEPPDALQRIVERRVEIEVLRHLPDIVDLSIILQRKFNWQLNKRNVYGMSASMFDRRYAESTLSRHFRSFIDAWNKVCGSLKGHQFFYKTNKYSLPEKICNVISEDSPMSTFIFAPADGNICPLALATYLAERQNDFLKGFNPKLSRGRNQVDLQMMTKSYAITLADDRDLLPVILGHYYLSQPDPEENAEFQFRYSHILERLDNILMRRARLLVIPGRESSDDTVELPVLHFHEPVVTAEHFLKITILQEPLEVQAKEEIQSRCLVNISDLRDSCDLVEKGIAFLQHTSDKYPVGYSLKKYMVEQLKLDTAVMDNILKTCELRHVKSLWLLLRFELEKALAWEKQECLESVDRSYKQSLDSMVDTKDSLEKSLKIKERAVQECLLKHLHDFFALKLSATGGRTELDYKPDDELFPKLLKFCEDEKLSDTQNIATMYLLRNLSKDFKEITLKYCVSVWLVVFETWRYDTF